MAQGPVPDRWSPLMKGMAFASASLFVLATQACADPFDCGSFPNDRARLSCYDAISRGPNPYLAEQALLPDDRTPKPVLRRKPKHERTRHD
jgi:hypothetical protein